MNTLSTVGSFTTNEVELVLKDGGGGMFAQSQVLLLLKVTGLVVALVEATSKQMMVVV